MQSAERKPTGLERMALGLLEKLLRDFVGKSPDELRAVFEATIANINAASIAYISIEQRLARLEFWLGAIAAKVGVSIITGSEGRPQNGADQPAALYLAAENRPGGSGATDSGADDSGKPVGGTS